MSQIEVFLIGIGLSMDAFSVAVCKGLNAKKKDYKQALLIALFFGGFQMLMPILGWLVGSRFENYIKHIDHWIAFLLLGFIGGKMIYEALRAGKKAAACCARELNIKELLALSVATSIDALAAGLGFALLGVGILRAASVIGLTTFAISYIGVIIGCSLGTKIKQKAEIVGGSVLVVLGFKILFEHVGILAL